MQDLLTATGSEPQSMSDTEMDNLMMALEAPILSRDDLLTMLRKQREKIVNLKRLLHNHYSKHSKHLKKHQLMATKHETEMSLLKAANEQLLADKIALEEALKTQNAEMATKNEMLQKAVAVCRLLNHAKSSR